MGCGGGYNDFDVDVSEADILVSRASKLSEGARIVSLSKGPEILVFILSPLPSYEFVDFLHQITLKVLIY